MASSQRQSWPVGQLQRCNEHHHDSDSQSIYRKEKRKSTKTSKKKKKNRNETLRGTYGNNARREYVMSPTEIPIRTNDINPTMQTYIVSAFLIPLKHDTPNRSNSGP
ncbi:hypothetical protein V6Z88_001720 [Aspergillus fumigatus]